MDRLVDVFKGEEHGFYIKYNAEYERALYYTPLKITQIKRNDI